MRWIAHIGVTLVSISLLGQWDPISSAIRLTGPQAAAEPLDSSDGTSALTECFKQALLKVDAGGAPVRIPDSIAPALPDALQTPGDADPGAANRTAAPLAPVGIPGRPEGSLFLKRGDALLAVGDLASARLFYERAADYGIGRAATGVAKTLDPIFLEQAGFRLAPGDAPSALSWYRRAIQAGDPDAEARLVRLLNRFPNLRRP
jgi:hypothetical protein